MSPSLEQGPWLSREQIDSVIDTISAGDLIEALDTAGSSKVKMPMLAFDTAAARMGLSNGTPATAHVSAADFVYLAKRIGEVINVDSPLSSDTSALLDSAATGE
jgi:hypothetical protein